MPAGSIDVTLAASCGCDWIFVAIGDRGVVVDVVVDVGGVVVDVVGGVVDVVAGVVDVVVDVGVVVRGDV